MPSVNCGGFKIKAPNHFILCCSSLGSQRNASWRAASPQHGAGCLEWDPHKPDAVWVLAVQHHLCPAALLLPQKQNSSSCSSWHVLLTTNPGEIILLLKQNLQCVIYFLLQRQLMGDSYKAVSCIWRKEICGCSAGSRSACNWLTRYTGQQKSSRMWRSQ